MFAECQKDKKISRLNSRNKLHQKAALNSLVFFYKKIIYVKKIPQQISINNTFFSWLQIFSLC